MGESCLAYISSEFKSTMTAAAFSEGIRTEAPWTVPSCVRMKLLPKSKISCSRRVLLTKPSCRMGTLAASYFRILLETSRRHLAQ